MSDEAINEYIESERNRFVSELQKYLRIPSISTESEYREDVRKCAEWIEEHLRDFGIETTEIHETPGHPVVYAEHIEHEGAPTALIYGHYDVQPPDPYSEWTTPPFAPDIRDEKVFARGATDNKGQHFAHLKAIESHLQVHGELPVNIKILLEGEEEIGSRHLHDWVREHQSKLEADAVVISDSAMFDRGLPTITYGLRGLVYLDVEARGPASDLHSGLYGGTIPNPVDELSRIIGDLHTDEGKIAVDGFYENVRELTPEERSEFARLPFDEEKYREETGASHLGGGEENYSVLERRWTRPTLDCNGINGGFTGEGAKTIIPSRASAKISSRLVPNQDPDRIGNLLERHLTEAASGRIDLRVEQLHSGDPVLVDRDAEPVRAAARASKRAWNTEAVFTRNGGSIPVVATLDESLEAPIVLLGFGLHGDRLHSPDEKFELENLFKGIETSYYLWNELES